MIPIKTNLAKNKPIIAQPNEQLKHRMSKLQILPDLAEMRNSRRLTTEDKLTNKEGSSQNTFKDYINRINKRNSIL